MSKEYPWQTIHGKVPSKSNCYKIITKKDNKTGRYHGSLAKTDALTEYENIFFIQCNHYRNKPMINGYFEINLRVFYPTQQADLDNSLKIILDCLQQKCKAIKNDNRCVKINAEKYLDKTDARIEFQLIEV